MVDGEHSKPKKKKSSKKERKDAIETVSGKVDNANNEEAAPEEPPAVRKSSKKKKKDKTMASDQSLRSSGSDKPHKKRRSKSGSKKPLTATTEADEVADDESATTRSVVNLLSAASDPATTGNVDVSDGSDDQPIEQPKPRRKKKSSKSSAGGSKPSLQDSQSSLRDYFPDPVMKNYLQGLYDDVESLDGDGNESPRFTPSPALLPQFPPSTQSGKFYVEDQNGFRKTSHKKLTSKLPGNQVQPDVQAPSMTPLDLGLQSQRVFRSIGIFCHGFLAGLAFWQLLMVFILSKGDVELMDFIELYSPLSQPLHLVFYFLTVICTISILDRYDIAQFDWRQVQMLLTFKSGGFAILIYVFTLIVTLVTTHIDDKLSLYQYNSTLFELTDPTELQHEITTWKALNMCRSIAVILGWIFVSARPNTDLLYKHLKRLSDYSTKTEHTA